MLKSERQREGSAAASAPVAVERGGGVLGGKSDGEQIRMKGERAREGTGGRSVGNGRREAEGGVRVCESKRARSADPSHASFEPR